MNMHVSVIKKHTHGDAINANPIHVFAMITQVILVQYVMLIRVIPEIIAVMLVKKNVKVIKTIMNIIVVLPKNIIVVPQKKPTRIM